MPVFEVVPQPGLNVAYIFGSAPRPAPRRRRKPLVHALPDAEPARDRSRERFRPEFAAAGQRAAAREHAGRCDGAARAGRDVLRSAPAEQLETATGRPPARDGGGHGACQQQQQGRRRAPLRLFSSQTSSPLTLSEPSPSFRTASRGGGSSTTDADDPLSCTKRRGGPLQRSPACSALSAAADSSPWSSSSSSSSRWSSAVRGGRRDRPEAGAGSGCAAAARARASAKRCWSLPRLWACERRSFVGTSDENPAAGSSSTRSLLRSRGLRLLLPRDFRSRLRPARTRRSPRGNRGWSAPRLWKGCTSNAASFDDSSSASSFAARSRGPAPDAKDDRDGVFPLTTANVAMHCLMTPSIPINKRAGLLLYLDAQISLLAVVQAMDPDRDLARAVAQVDYLMGLRWYPSVSSLSATSERVSAEEEGDSSDTELEVAFQDGRNFRVFRARSDERRCCTAAGVDDSAGSGAGCFYDAESGWTEKLGPDGCSGSPSERLTQRSTEPSVSRTGQADSASSLLASHTDDTPASSIRTCPPPHCRDGYSSDTPVYRRVPGFLDSRRSLPAPPPRSPSADNADVVGFPAAADDEGRGRGNGGAGGERPAAGSPGPTSRARRLSRSLPGAGGANAAPPPTPPLTPEPRCPPRRGRAAPPKLPARRSEDSAASSVDGF